MGWDGKEFDMSAGTQTVSKYPLEVRGVKINASLNAYDIELKDGTTTVDRIPAGATIGNTYPINSDYTNLVIVPNASSTGKINIVYRRKPGA